MLTIHLDQLRFFAYHGLYEEEKILGNEFIVDISIQYQPAREIIQEIHETVDYTAVYALLEQRMKQPTELLETLACEFCQMVLDKFPMVENITFRINKIHPPIPKFEGSVGISYLLKRSDP